MPEIPASYGHPVPTKVSLGHKKGKAILVSGHDLKDLADLLETNRWDRDQHLHAWRDASDSRIPGTQEVSSFLRPLRNSVAKPAERVCGDFPGPILMTTNCIQRPQGRTPKIFSRRASLVGRESSIVKNGIFLRDREGYRNSPDFRRTRTARKSWWDLPETPS